MYHDLEFWRSGFLRWLLPRCCQVVGILITENLDDKFSLKSDANNSNVSDVQVVSDQTMTKSGVYWSWNNDSNSFENELSQEASNAEKARKLWELSEKLVGLA